METTFTFNGDKYTVRMIDGAARWQSSGLRTTGWKWLYRDSVMIQLRGNSKRDKMAIFAMLQNAAAQLV